VTLATPPCPKGEGDHVRIVPGDVLVKFEVRFEATCRWTINGMSPLSLWRHAAVDTQNDRQNSLMEWKKHYIRQVRPLFYTRKTWPQRIPTVLRYCRPTTCCIVLKSRQLRGINGVLARWRSRDTTSTVRLAVNDERTLNENKLRLDSEELQQVWKRVANNTKFTADYSRSLRTHDQSWKLEAERQHLAFNCKHSKLEIAPALTITVKLSILLTIKEIWPVE